MLYRYAERAKILQLIFRFITITSILLQTSESSTRYAVPSRTLYRKATRTVESNITGVATNNYSMNFNYLSTEGGNWPPIHPPLFRLYCAVQIHALFDRQQHLITYQLNELPPSGQHRTTFGTNITAAKMGHMYHCNQMCNMYHCNQMCNMYHCNQMCNMYHLPPNVQSVSNWVTCII